MTVFHLGMKNVSVCVWGGGGDWGAGGPVNASA